MVQRFPGPLWFDRKRPHRRLPRGRDVCALSRGFVAFRERAVPYIVSLIESSDADTRFYATLLAAELISADFMISLGQRLFDPDPGTQLLAIDVLRYYGAFKKEMEELLKGIRVEARVDRKDPERRRAAVRALGGLRDAKSLDLLVELLGVRERELALEAHGALQVLTRHDFGDTPRKWAPWLEKNRDRHRIEWLIDALTDTSDEVRIASSDELKVLTQEYFGFHPSMPKRDREIAQRKYRDWWQSEGRHRFA
jgi:HEAT repeat protein